MLPLTVPRHLQSVLTLSFTLPFFTIWLPELLISLLTFPFASCTTLLPQQLYSLSFGRGQSISTFFPCPGNQKVQLFGGTVSAYRWAAEQQFTGSKMREGRTWNRVQQCWAQVFEPLPLDPTFSLHPLQKRIGAFDKLPSKSCGGKMVSLIPIFTHK